MSGAAAFHTFFHFILTAPVAAFSCRAPRACLSGNDCQFLHRVQHPSQACRARPNTNNNTSNSKISKFRSSSRCLSVLYIVSHLILTAAPEGIITIVILQLRKLRLKGVEKIFHSHILGSGGLEPRQCDSFRTALSTRLCWRLTHHHLSQEHETLGGNSLMWVACSSSMCWSMELAGGYYCELDPPSSPRTFCSPWISISMQGQDFSHCHSPGKCLTRNSKEKLAKNI